MRSILCGTRGRVSEVHPQPIFPATISPPDETWLAWGLGTWLEWTWWSALVIAAASVIIAG
ncbi:MAG: hypothetical protein KA314_14165 [Chloroflexi bacterium]|nr:hypothetical protein [Chloroflexota bacterium]MBP8056979.1 hypothetical protein [Chloroflexota bacterium]